MNTKNILKTLALAMLMPAILLTTACSNDDDAVNTENTAKKGYALPVTINEDHGVGSPDHIQKSVIFMIIHYLFHLHFHLYFFYLEK